jgi:hypothetical protein
LTEVGFSGDHKIKRDADATVIDTDDSTPIWKRDNSVDEPVAYTQGTNPTAFAKFNTQPGSIGGLTLRIMYNAAAAGGATPAPVEVARKSNVSLSNGQAVTGITFSSAIEATPRITNEEYNLTWQVSLDGEQWTTVGASKHRFYWTGGAPQGASAQPYETFIDAATTYRKSRQNVGLVAALEEGLRNAGKAYDPTKEDEPTSDVTALLALFNGSAGNNCAIFASWLRALHESVGGSGGTVNIAYMGSSTWTGSDRFHLYTWTSDEDITFHGGNIPTSGTKKPHLKYHAIYTQGGTDYDAVWGWSGPSFASAITERHASATYKSGAWTNNYTDSDWICPHSSSQ